jgi:hypothetical protein
MKPTTSQNAANSVGWLRWVLRMWAHSRRWFVYHYY